MRSDHLLAEETNLLYALLDAAAAAGSFPPAQRARWRECQKQFNPESARRFGPELYALLDEIGRAGGPGEDWIHKRWLALRAQVEARLSPAGPSVIRGRRGSSATRS